MPSSRAASRMCRTPDSMACCICFLQALAACRSASVVVARQFVAAATGVPIMPEKRRIPRRGSLPRIARDRGEACLGLEPRPSLMLHLRNTISALHPTPNAALFGLHVLQAHCEIRSRLTLGRRALRLHSFSGKCNGAACVQDGWMCALCRRAGCCTKSGVVRRATWVQCGVSAIRRIGARAVGTDQPSIFI